MLMILQEKSSSYEGNLDGWLCQLLIEKCFNEVGSVSVPLMYLKKIADYALPMIYKH